MVPVEWKVDGSNPTVGFFFFFLSLFPFFPSPSHFPLQARSATSNAQAFF